MSTLAARNLVVLPLADVDHGNINRMCQALAQGLLQCGLEPAIIDYREPGEAPFRHLERLVSSGRVLSIMAMNAVGFPLVAHDMIARQRIRLFVFGTDHPCHLYPLMEVAPAGTTLSFPSASNLNCCHGWGLDLFDFLHIAHGAEPRKPIAWADRSLPFLLVGNLRKSSAQLRSSWTTRGPEIPVLEAMADMIETDGTLALENLCHHALAATGNSDGPLSAPRAIAKIMRYFDPYARALMRESILQGLAELPLTVVGDWRGLEASIPDTVRFAGPLDSKTVQDMAEHAKCIVDTTPAYYRSHERLFEGLAGGSLVAMIGKMDFNDLNTSGALIQASRPDHLADRIAQIWNYDEDLAQRADAGRAAVIHDHTWTSRARCIKDALCGDTAPSYS